jgi:hypothetical protein
MIDVKQAVQIAKAGAVDLLSQNRSNLEEIERDSYKGREVWSITLSLPRDTSLPQNPNQLAPLSRLAMFYGDLMQYKRFLIDVETGELLAMQLREVASQ